MYPLWYKEHAENINYFIIPISPASLFDTVKTASSIIVALEHIIVAIYSPRFANANSIISFRQSSNDPQSKRFVSSWPFYIFLCVILERNPTHFVNFLSTFEPRCGLDDIPTLFTFINFQMFLMSGFLFTSFVIKYKEIRKKKEMCSMIKIESMLYDVIILQ